MNIRKDYFEQSVEDVKEEEWFLLIKNFCFYGVNIGNEVQ